MIVLRTPKGWTGPKIVDGLKVEGAFRAHQVPIPEARDNPEHLRLLEEWMRSYRPAELFGPDGTLVAELAALPPRDGRRMSASPHANGACCCGSWICPTSAATRSQSPSRAAR